MSRPDTGRDERPADENPKRAHPGADAPSNLQKDPGDWVTGDEAMTDAQASYLKTLSEEAHEPFEGGLTKAEASRRIDALQARTGRGAPRSEGDRDDPGRDAADRDGRPARPRH